MPRPLILKKRSKFGAVKSEYGGQVYDSKREAAHAYSLDMLKAAIGPDRVSEWTRQQRYPLVVNGSLIGTYVADFCVRYSDGRVELHETKGMETQVWRLKERLFRALFPNVILRVIR